jgi:hypothetical protein
LNGLAHRVLNGSGGGAGEFDDFIDWVFHISPYFPNKLHKLMLLTYTEAA